MLKIIITLLLFASLHYFYARRSLRYLRFFQQQEYSHPLYLKWLWDHKALDRKATVIIVASTILSAFLASSPFLILAGFIVSTAFCIIPSFEEDPRQLGKIPLRMTERATRIYRVAFIFFTLIAVVWAFLFYFDFPFTIFAWVLLLFAIQSTPIWLVIADIVLAPRERALQEGFLGEAKETIASVNPFIIGITGSYGKTSTKAILGEVMGVCLGPTFWPPKSFNTLMGITREVRERLRPGYRYAVIEMGAYRIGSIKKLCGLCPPKAGIITAVGVMHLERFGSEENIFKAKSELAQAIPNDGILVCNGDNIGARKIAEQNKKRITMLYGFDTERGRLDCWMTDIEATEKGSSFVIYWQNNAYKGGTKLLGSAALSNILASFTMAVALGGDPELLLAAIRNIEPIENRLSLQKDGDVLWLKDAYNSNPDGFTTALDVLKAMTGGRKILMTPGMIELGSHQHEANFLAAKQAALICDLVLVVGKTNKEVLSQGLTAGGFNEEKILYFPHRNPALEYFALNRKAGDVILIENDLSDLYEMNASF